jgi:hypothetical protein
MEQLVEYSKSIRKAYGEKAKKMGLLESTLLDYYNHIIKMAPGQKEVTPDFLRKRVIKPDGTMYTTKELLDKGYEIETDEALTLPAYVLAMERVMANRQFARDLVASKATNDLPVLMPRDKVPVENSGEYIQIRDDYLRSWHGQLKREFGEKFAKEQVGLFTSGTPTMIHKDAFKLVDSLFMDPGNTMWLEFSRLQSKVKRILMWNLAVHGFNLTSAYAMYSGHHFFDIFQKRTPEQMREVEQRFIGSGGELFGLYDIGKKLASDIYSPRDRKNDFKPKDLIDNPGLVVKNPIAYVREASDYVL